MFRATDVCAQALPLVQWEKVARLMGNRRTPKSYREHWRLHLSPRALQTAQLDELENDLLLVRNVYDTGAVHESEVTWASLNAGRGAKERFDKLRKRLPIDCSSLPFDEIVDRLLVILQRASENRAKVAKEEAENIERRARLIERRREHAEAGESDAND